MKKSFNRLKSEKLGMPYGTACYKLRKSIMFMLIQRCNLDICKRCSKKIGSKEEMSIEHIRSWVTSTNPFNDFFDLDNIAFSHTDCNYHFKTRSKRVYGKSKFKGVSSEYNSKRKRKWKASLFINGRMRFLGYFKNEEEAAKRYDEEAEKEFGENAITNKSLSGGMADTADSKSAGEIP